MIKTFYFNDLRTCCYVLYDEAGECAIIDPGCIKQSERDRLVKFIEENHLHPRMILQTHGHFDHVMGNAFVARTWNIPTYINSADIPQIRRYPRTSTVLTYPRYAVPPHTEAISAMSSSSLPKTLGT